MQIKPFKEYCELIELLQARGMKIRETSYAKKKLAQVGYYRLSGFWHISRTANQDNSLSDQFLPNTNFDEIYRLYIFDKKLRLLLLDIIERLEVHVRSVIAHELGRFDPLAYLKDDFINPQYNDRYQIWKDKLISQIDKSRDDFVLWHKEQSRDLPFWAVVEVWDFGTLSKYYSMLKKRFQNKIAVRFNANNTATFISWLNEINIIRNQAAHHSRIWNKKGNPIKILDNSYFNELNLDHHSKRRLFSRIVVMWYLISQTSKNYKWLDHLSSLILENFPSVPNAKLTSMGIIGDPEDILQQLKQLV
ncbi:Abi family protein [Avibacterium paragallinarum]|uniref:Abortive phage infection protein n=1 Tax=Avibacterium paragallinarum TaxID=728 RepID=A0AAE5TJY1_AVIPA|nr:Abi family protein [Avibacterium paragallinarum]MEE3607692.1 Abi family protein [Avibacterium paragallinarum]MEE3620422.1 Abi family protein [Avibacterium paragallinarum]MEE3668443.1 Abi family protein [Avibacterium paragallinarum]MEE3680799.1 Abi family protein [Avibacterium paragallinarum]MEE4385546.1 Abi family protein [Avibacterium paragallinarum]